VGACVSFSLGEGLIVCLVIRNETPPIIPQVEHPFDTRYFTAPCEDFEDDEIPYFNEPKRPVRFNKPKEEELESDAFKGFDYSCTKVPHHWEKDISSDGSLMPM
jgi:hypothetical protein